MKILLDTHIAAWATRHPERLSVAARSVLEDLDHELWFSQVALWEIAIKRERPRPSTEGLPPTAELARQEFLQAGFLPLTIRDEHIFALQAVPLTHTDPFDRLLIAQSTVEGWRFLTHDRRLAHLSELVWLV